MVIKNFVGILYLSFAMVSNVNSDGQLFIGFLGYSNPTNTDYDGICCTKEISTRKCGQCDLVFRVSVQSFNSSEESFPTDKPIKSKDAEQFNSQIEGHEVKGNPTQFEFKKWLGDANIIINVFHMDKNESRLVDNFTFTFTSKKANWQYIPMNVSGTKSNKNSELKLLLRYNCGTPNQPSGVCYDNECTAHTDEKKCTANPNPDNKNSTSWIILQPSTTPNECSHLGLGNITNLFNCTTDANFRTTEAMLSETEGHTTENVFTTEETTQDSTTAELLTEPVTATKSIATTFEATSESGTSSSSIDITTENYKQSTIPVTLAVSTSHEDTTTEKVTTESIPKTTEKTVQTTEKITKAVDLTTAKPVTSARVRTSTLVTTKIASTDRNDIKVTVTHEPSSQSTVAVDINTTVEDKNDGAMKYWPAIVGGVLGACLIAGVVSYLIYSRRRKLQKKNNDIYNVNPKRWVFDPPTENGTSGKSEIALETEQV